MRDTGVVAKTTVGENAKTTVCRTVVILFTITNVQGLSIQLISALAMRMLLTHSRTDAFLF